MVDAARACDRAAAVDADADAVSRASAAAVTASSDRTAFSAGERGDAAAASARLTWAIIVTGRVTRKVAPDVWRTDAAGQGGGEGTGRGAG